MAKLSVTAQHELGGDGKDFQPQTPKYLLYPKATMSGIPHSGYTIPLAIALFFYQFFDGLIN